MSTDAPGSFRFGVDAVTAPFKYRVAAGPLTSPVYEVAVAHAPRVKRIDVEYTYPAGLRLPPRTESDGGDIYAPPGTDVRVRVFTDRPAATGEMTLGDGKRLALTSDAPTELSASLKVVDDNSYRVALADREGMGNSGETEYFIRTLDDRPPDVRILKPASDRSVTRLEEVDVEAQAEDDYGVDRLDLVYSVHGTEKVVPLPIARRRDASTGVTPSTSRISTCSRATSCPTTSARATSRAARGRTRPAATCSFWRSSRTSRSSCSPGARAGWRAPAPTASTTSSSRRRKSSSRRGSSIGGRRRRKARSPSRTFGRSRARKRT